MSLEVLFNCEKDHIKRKDDAIVCAIHCYLTASGYKCIGAGEEIPKCDVRKSDMLPAGWSNTDGIYSIMYQRADGPDTATHLLKVISMDESLLVHFLRTSDEKVADMEIKTDEFVTNDFSSFDRMFRDLGTLEKRFKTDILNALAPQALPSTTAPAPDRSRPDPHDPLRVNPTRSQARPDQWEPPGNPFPSIGRGDLDPLGGGVGGGMMFDPFRPGGGAPCFGGRGGYRDPSGFPSGSIVPGARFDPARPPGVDPSGNFQPCPPRNRFDPDPDHQRMPGFDDDLYM